jgi:hypothetical protein
MYIKLADDAASFRLELPDLKRTRSRVAVPHARHVTQRYRDSVEEIETSAPCFAHWPCNMIREPYLSANSRDHIAIYSIYLSCRSMQYCTKIRKLQL